MLRLHNTNCDVILFGLLFEITEYARYAYEGKLDEKSNYYSYRDNDAGNADLRLPRHDGQLLVWTWRPLRFVQQGTGSPVRKHHAGSLCGSTTRFAGTWMHVASRSEERREGKSVPSV